MEEFIAYLNEIQEQLKEILSEYWRKVAEIEESHGRNVYGVMTPEVSVASMDYEAIEMLKSLSNNGNSLEEIATIIESSKGEAKNKQTLIHAIKYIEEYKRIKGIEKRR